MGAMWALKVCVVTIFIYDQTVRGMFPRMVIKIHVKLALCASYMRNVITHDKAVLLKMFRTHYCDPSGGCSAQMGNVALHDSRMRFSTISTNRPTLKLSGKRLNITKYLKN